MKSLNKLFLVNGLIISLFFVSSYSHGQQVSVKDETSNENLSDVVIFNEDKSESIITDLNGVVDLSVFKFILNTSSICSTSISFSFLVFQVPVEKKQISIF